MAEITMELDDRTIEVEIIRSKRKTLGLEVRWTGDVIVKAPFRTSERRIKSFLEQYRTWIERKLIKAEQQRDRADCIRFKEAEELTEKERQEIREHVAEKVAYYAGIMGVSYGRITIRNQKTRWGSCSSNGNLNFNYRIYALPEELQDYIVIHELAHRRHMNHSADFWNEVGRYDPEYREHVKRMRQIHFAR